MAAMLATSSRGMSLSRPKRCTPFKGSRVPAVVVRAESSDSSAAVASTSKVPIQMTWVSDTETIRDVFAFAGSAPERVNGRIAMWGWAFALSPELQKHISVADQFGDAWFGIVSFTFLIGFASILPKLVSGTSLKELHAAATSENLKSEGLLGQVISLFDTNLELWAGRLAMAGMAGIVALEAFKGESFF